MSKKKLNNADLQKYTLLDEKCGVLHKKIRVEKDKAKLILLFNELIKTYDVMASIVKPSWMERIAIRQLVKQKELLKRSHHSIKPKEALSEAELEKGVSEVMRNA